MGRPNRAAVICLLVLTGLYVVHGSALRGRHLIDQGNHVAQRNSDFVVPRGTSSTGNSGLRQLLISREDINLWNAANENSTVDALAALAEGADVNVTIGNEGLCPCPVLTIAVVKRNARIVRELIASGADVNAATAFGGATPLFIAAQAGFLDITTLLIEAGAEVNKPVHSGSSSLTISAEKGHADIVEVLLAAGADANMPDTRSQFPLHFSSLTIGDSSVVVATALLANGAMVDPRDQDDWTPLMWAAHFGNEGTVRVLVDANADVDATASNGRKVVDFVCTCPLAHNNTMTLTCPTGGCDSGSRSIIIDILST